MSAHATTTDGLAGTAWTPAQAPYTTSPFTAASVLGAAVPVGELELGSARGLVTPFAHGLASLDEVALEDEAFEALMAEMEDEGFAEALDAVADEVAGRHLAGSDGLGSQAEALAAADADAEQWMEVLASRADRLLGALEAHFGERPVEGVTDGEIDAVTGSAGLEDEAAGPLDAQELFLAKLVSKVKKVVKGAAKVVGKLLPIGKLLGVLKKVVRPLLRRVLQKAIGKLPPDLQPVARRLAARFAGRSPGAGSSTGAAAPVPAPAGPAAPPPGAAVPGDDGGADAGPPVPADAAGTAPAAEEEGAWSSRRLAGRLDATMAEAVLAPDDAAVSELLAELEQETAAVATSAGEDPVAALDSARRRLVDQLLEAEAGTPPVEQMEQFVPAVMAVMKFVKLGVKVVGRKRVVEFLAKLLATLVKDMVGPQGALQLSRHVADVGLRLVGLEAERAAGGTLGAQALVATVEDTVREVMAMPARSLEDELLLETAVQEAFTAAALRHVPPQLLRPDLVESQPEGDRGIWVLQPRTGAARYRYKKYTVVQPVVLTPGVARAITFADGGTLEERLLDAGARSWPVQAEAHFYELLPGAQLGHLAAFELEGEGIGPSEGALEFESLSAARPLPFRHPSPGGGAGPRGPSAGARVVRLKVRGLRPRPQRRFTVRLDLSGPRPVLDVHLRIGERVAHEIVGHLEKRRLPQVVTTVRGLVGPPARQALAETLTRVLGRHGVTLPEGGAARLADALCESLLRTVAQQLHQSAAALTTAAQHPDRGVTLTFAFTFEGRQALGRAPSDDPTLAIRSGARGD
ncbi:hypothetical protein [Cellulomonas endophytica]|uniref:hypothetical protein n=1 Tax=Cellulomonas endophytica TaxID=2494735 RepID=UPI0013E96FBF|nr:hypothetical protein [Cellulomonas endophytica]